MLSKRMSSNPKHPDGGQGADREAQGPQEDQAEQVHVHWPGLFHTCMHARNRKSRWLACMHVLETEKSPAFLVSSAHAHMLTFWHSVLKSLAITDLWWGCEELDMT